MKYAVICSGSLVAKALLLQSRHRGFESHPEYMAKWIEFIELDFPNRKTKTFDVVNKDNSSYIGQIKWFGSFRKYSFFPAENCVFEQTCLRDIAKFMEDLMEERKKQL